MSIDVGLLLGHYQLYQDFSESMAFLSCICSYVGHCVFVFVYLYYGKISPMEHGVPES